MRSAQTNSSRVNAAYQQLARMASKKDASHKLTALEPQISMAQLVEKLTRKTLTEHTSISSRSKQFLFSQPQKNMDIDVLTTDDVRVIKQDNAYGINVKEYKYSNAQKFKRILLFRTHYANVFDRKSTNRQLNPIFLATL